MSQSMPKKQGSHLPGITGLFLILLLGGMSTMQGDDDPAAQKAVSLQQEKSDLLAGYVKAIAYSGFRHGQHPDRGEGAVFPSDAEILEDLQILTRNGNFGLIRLYDSQENSESVLRIIRENNINVKVMLGIWLSAELSNHEGCPWLTEPIPQTILDANKIKNKQEINRAIRLCKAYPDIIVAVNVGNEALVSWNDHMVSVDSIISYVKRVKQAVEPLVTVADNYDWWAKNGAALARELDFIGVHSYPVWEGKDIDAGLSFTIENLQAVRKALPESKIVIAEAGWATVASEFGERASEENQKRYYNELMSWAEKMNMTTFFFEAFDEDWKGDPNNPLGAEKHWGIFTIDRKAKLVMYELYPDLIPEKVENR